MANRVPKITDPENQLDYVFDCTTVREGSWQMKLLECMDRNNDFEPNMLTRRYLEQFVGAMKDDYALRFKYCIFNKTPYICAYFSAIHYVFKVTA